MPHPRASQEETPPPSGDFFKWAGAAPARSTEVDWLPDPKARAQFTREDGEDDERVRVVAAKNLSGSEAVPRFGLRWLPVQDSNP